MQILSLKAATSILAGSIALALGSSASFSQQLPDAGRVLKEIEGNAPAAKRPKRDAIEFSGGNPALADSESRVMVRGFRIKGATVFDEKTLQDLLADLVDRELSFQQLQTVPLIISRHYRKNGLVSRALIQRQTIEQGIVEITVIEGRLGEVVTAPSSEGQRLQAEVARQIVLGQQMEGDLLRPEAVQKGVRLVNELPGVQASGAMAGGKERGSSNVLLTLSEGPLLNGQVALDNAGSVFTGKEQLSANISINDPSGQGDAINIMALGAKGTQFLRAGYQTRLGYSGLRAGAHATSMGYQIGGALQNLDANGTASIVGLTLSFPLLRSNALDLDLKASTDQKTLVNNANQINTSNKAIAVNTVGVGATQQDSFGGGGVNQFDLNLSRGHLNLNTNAADSASDLLAAQTQGEFRKITYGTSRVQQASKDVTFYFSLKGQTSAQNLDSSEQFALGGQGGVRAFASSEAAGDEGWILSSELRYQWSQTTQFQTFVDTGKIRLHRNLWSTWDAARPGQPNEYQLNGAGFGFTYSKANDFTMKGSVAWQIGGNSGTADNCNSDGSCDSSRIWVQFTKSM